MHFFNPLKLIYRSYNHLLVHKVSNFHELDYLTIFCRYVVINVFKNWINNENKTFIFEVRIKDQPTLRQTTSFSWWWISVDAGGAAVLGLGIWLIIKKNRRHK